MQPATTTTAAPKKKTSRWIKSALCGAFVLALGGHLYRDHLNTQIREAQDGLIEAQRDLIDAQALAIAKLKAGGAAQGSFSCDDGFIIQDLDKGEPMQVKAAKPAATRAAKTI